MCGASPSGADACPSLDGELLVVPPARSPSPEASVIGFAVSAVPPQAYG